MAKWTIHCECGTEVTIIQPDDHSEYTPYGVCEKCGLTWSAHYNFKTGKVEHHPYLSPRSAWEWDWDRTMDENMEKYKEAWKKLAEM